MFWFNTTAPHPKSEYNDSNLFFKTPSKRPSLSIYFSANSNKSGASAINVEAIDQMQELLQLNLK